LRNQVLQAANPQRVVEMMSQAEAISIDTRAMSSATIANAFFISAVATFVIGGVLWLLSLEPVPTAR
jgi:hypothetical protein